MATTPGEDEDPHRADLDPPSPSRPPRWNISERCSASTNETSHPRGLGRMVFCPGPLGCLCSWPAACQVHGSSSAIRFIGSLVARASRLRQQQRAVRRDHEITGLTCAAGSPARRPAFASEDVGWVADDRRNWCGLTKGIDRSRSSRWRSACRSERGA